MREETSEDGLVESRPVTTGSIAFVPDGDGRAGWTVLVNGVPSSHLDLDDPTRLDFEYMRWTGDLLDVVRPPGERLRVVHLGGAGCTLARYVAATRPRSRQIVLEIDPGVVDAVRIRFGLDRRLGIRVRVADARAGLAEIPAASQDVVVRDAFAGTQVPDHLRTTGFLRAVCRVLAFDGVYVANLADTPPLRLARSEAATALAVFGHVTLAAEPAQFAGRRHGNLLLMAARVPLPTGDLARRLAGGVVRARLMTTAQVRGFAAGWPPLDDPP